MLRFLIGCALRIGVCVIINNYLQTSIIRHGCGLCCSACRKLDPKYGFLSQNINNLTSKRFQFSYRCSQSLDDLFKYNLLDERIVQVTRHRLHILRATPNSDNALINQFLTNRQLILSWRQTNYRRRSSYRY
jgi:hypothetical protein